MKKTYRRHSEEFKKEVTDYFLSSSKSITQICKEFTISPNQFYSWKQKILGECVESQRMLRPFRWPMKYVGYAMSSPKVPKPLSHQRQLR